MITDEITVNDTVYVPKQTMPQEPTDPNDLYSDFLGRYVLIRSKNEGVNAGYLQKATKAGCILSEARRLWFHRPKDETMSWYEGVAVSGVSGDSKLSHPTDKLIVEAYSVTVCSQEATASIRGKRSHEQ